MACVEIFQNKNTGDLVLCSFVLCAELGGGNSSTGRLMHIPLDDFTTNGADFVTNEFELYYTREYRIPSELYEEMTKSEQRKFFSQHKKVIIDRPMKDSPVEVYIGPNDDLYGRLDIPFDKATFADYILKALAKAG